MSDPSKAVTQMMLEASAELVSFGYNGPERTFTIVRRFPQVRDSSIEEAIKYADEYISTANAAPSAVITNPKAKGSEKGFFEGEYRLLRNDRGSNGAGENAQGVIQTLVQAIPWTMLAILRQSGGVEQRYSDFFFNLTEAAAAAFSHGTGSPTGWDAPNNRPAAGWVFSLSAPAYNPANGSWTIERTREYEGADLTASDALTPRHSDSFEEDFYTSSRETARTGQAAPLADVAFTNGQLSSTRNRKNARTSLWETVLQLTVAKPYCSGTGAIGGAIPGEWNPWETYPDRGSVTQRCYFRNLTRAQVDIILATLTNATSNDPNVGEPNRFGLYDGHITVAPWTVNIGGTGWAPGSGSVVGYTWDRRDTDPDGGNKCVRKLTWTIGRIASASKSTVNGYIGGKGSPDSGELRGGFWGTFRTLTSVGEWQETP